MSAQNAGNNLVATTFAFETSEAPIQPQQRFAVRSFTLQTQRCSGATTRAYPRK
jgi:hypothetical protein